MNKASKPNEGRRLHSSIGPLLRTTGLTIGFLATLGLNFGHASSPHSLDGAWVEEPNKCTDVFASSNGRVSFRKGDALALPGFIIEGRHIRGPTASCDVASTKTKGDTTSVLLDCRSQIMFGRMAVTMRILSADSLQRIDPEFPDIAETYHRCSPR